MKSCCFLSIIFFKSEVLENCVSGGAVITNPPLNQNKTEGDMVSFVCEGEGTPGNLSVSWYRDNLPITSVGSMHGRVNVQTSGNLIINPVKADDAGSYVCEVTNGIGRPQRATASLEVTCEYQAEAEADLNSLSSFLSVILSNFPYFEHYLVSCYIKLLLINLNILVINGLKQTGNIKYYIKKF